MPSTVTLFDIPSQHLPAPIPCAVLAPVQEERLPLCIFLLGAGGTRDSMVELQPVFDGWWAEGAVPRMMVATPTAGLDYYISKLVSLGVDANAEVLFLKRPPIPLQPGQTVAPQWQSLYADSGSSVGAGFVGVAQVGIHF